MRPESQGSARFSRFPGVRDLERRLVGGPGAAGSGTRLVLLRISTLIIALFAAASLRADSKSVVNRFENTILTFEAIDKKNPPPKGAVLFVGDSLFALWQSIQSDFPSYTVINRGFGGSRMSDFLHHTDRIVMRYKPRLIIVDEGNNDIHDGRTPEEV